MRTFGKVMIAVALVVAGCDDDDDNNAVLPDGATGDVTTFNVTMTSSQETPPCAAGRSDATGSVTVTIASDDSAIAVSGLTFSGLSGPATAAHIHSGARGVAGPIVFPLNVTLTPFSTVAFDAADYPTPVPAGASPDFPSFVAAMKAGNTYVNVHTAACPDGEIRAQLQ